MKNIKNIAMLFLAVMFLVSCNTGQKQQEQQVQEVQEQKEQEKPKRKGRFDFNQVKAELHLTKDQEQKFDTIVAKYQKVREESFAGFGESGAKPNRSVMMEKMQGIQKLQNKEIIDILNQKQMPVYEEFAEKMARFGKPGYSDKEIQKMTTELALDESQVKMLNAVNKAFEKSYSDAHDFYHGNGELAKEYWNKYDQERKNTLQKVFNEEQYSKYLEIAKELVFKGEHK